MAPSTLSPTEERDEWISDPFPSLGETPVLLPTVSARTVSMAIKAEKEDLKEAAKDSFNVIMDLNLDGHVRWVSPSWQDVIGTSCESIQGKSISTVLVEGAETFQLAIDTMKKQDSRSYKVRFAVNMGTMSTLVRDPRESAIAAEEEGFRPEEMDEVNHILEMEGQGILIFDRATGEASHTMWVLRPFIEPKEITIDLPQPIVDSLGVGAGMLARYLTSLAEDANDPANHPPPLPVLCRICECQIQPWWFEKHSELCMLEHKAESDVQIAHENLSVQRHAIVKVLDSMDRASSTRGQAAEAGGQGLVEYRGFSINPPSASSSGTASPAPSSARSRDSSVSGHRQKGFAIRRPQVRIVELLLDLCDTALEISTPSIKDTLGTGEIGTFRTQSPASEARISQVLQWQSPSTNTLEQEQGLALLCSDTELASRAKVDAVLRHRNTIEYSERIRFEFSVLVQDCIEEALRKANEADEQEHEYQDDREESDLDENEEVYTDNTIGSLPKEDNLVGALEEKRRLDLESAIESPGSSSPQEGSTPRSQHSTFRGSGRRRSRFSLQPPPDTDGGDSDASARSSLATTAPRTESPASDRESRARPQAPKDRKRHSLGVFQTGTASPNRQPSPARPTSSASPLRLSKPRLSAIFDGQIPTPITSPLLTTGELSSPALENFHHRRQSSTTSSDHVRPPPSPRLTAANPTQQKAAAPSIKDFEIIKPISKGAFGSVYLSKKKSTGDYFAIKVLKKADMIAKNQVTNVRAERAIMMVQGESDFVAKLFWTFSSKDYLYLVMEYMNGGDCAALIKALGGLPEDWTKKYLAEVVLGVEHLHDRGIIHRDLKPDNLLIDQKGHLKLTDFGLSRMGLLGRQKRALQGSTESTPDLLKQGPFMRSRSVASSRSASFDFPPGTASPANTPVLTPESSFTLSAPSYFNLNRDNSISREGSLKERRQKSVHRSDSGGSEGLATMFNSFSLNDPASFGLVAARRSAGQAVDDDAQSTSSASSDFSNSLGLQQVSTQSSSSLTQQSGRESMMPPQLALFDPEDSNRKFVGTPDYLAPETINGTGQDEMSDWWSLGCILFEFLYGYPPFHGETHERVFDNILNRRIDWPDDDDVPVSSEAKDLMNQLMCIDQESRLGTHGADEIKRHPFFEGLQWDQLLEDEASFIPAPADIEDTEYFDARGATLQPFTEELEDGGSSTAVTPGSEYSERPHDAVPRSRKESSNSKRGLMPLHIPPHVREGGRSRRLSEPMITDDFGSFQFKNLPVLEKANKDVIQRLRTEALQNSGGTSSSSTSSPTNSSEGSPVQAKATVSRTLSASSRNGSKRAVSPSNLHTSALSSPNRASQPSSPLLVSFTAQSHRKASNASTSSTVSSSAIPPPLVEIPRLSTNFKVPIPSPAPSSPVKVHSTSPVKTFAPLLKSQTLPTAATSLPRKDSVSGHRRSGSMRVRSLTVGSQDGEPPAFLDSLKQHKRRSQVFDMSPSSSDNEDTRSSALLRVQKRRQSSRRMSTFSNVDGPCYRPLDIMICEDHPVSRMVMERMLEKMGCRTISVENGSEAVRVAMSEVKFDMIFTEFRLPQINGEDFARMLKTTRNTNTHTPIVAVTGYLRDLKEPHNFDELIDKPATPDKLIETLDRLCQWRPADDHDKVPTPEQLPVDQQASKGQNLISDHEQRPGLERTVTAPLRPLNSLSPKSFLDAARNHGAEKRADRPRGIQRTYSEDHVGSRSSPRRSLSFSPLGEGGLGLPPPSGYANYTTTPPIPDPAPISPIKGLMNPMASPQENSVTTTANPSNRPPPVPSKNADRFSRTGTSLLSRAAVTARDFLLPHSSQAKDEPTSDIASGEEVPDTNSSISPGQMVGLEACAIPKADEEPQSQSVTSKWGDMLKSSLSSRSSNQPDAVATEETDKTTKPSSMKKSPSDPISLKSPHKTGMFKHARVQSPPRLEKSESASSRFPITSPTSRFIPTNTLRKDFANQPSSPARSPTRSTIASREKSNNSKSEPTTPKREKMDVTRTKSPSPEETPRSRFFRNTSKDKSLHVPKTDSADDEASSSPSKSSKNKTVREKRSRGFLGDIKRTKSDEFKT